MEPEGKIKQLLKRS